MTDTPFRIDIYDSAGTSKVGSGPLRNIIQLDDTRVLDKIGQLSFSVPANDPKVQYITSGSQFDVYDDTDGYLGRFLFNRMTTTDDLGRGIVTVECWSILKELQYYVTGFAREYTASQVETIIDNLVSDVTGWSTETEANMGTANVTYQGQTIYQSIEELAKRWGYHYRIKSGSERILEFKSLGDTSSGIRLINVDGQSIGIDNVTDIGIIKGVKKTISTDEVFNRVIALGAGTGAGQLTLKNGESGNTYTVQSRTRTNGQDETYIEDTVSIAQYGVREIVVVFDSIRPIANTTTSKNSAKTELLKNAEIWLGRYKDAREQYDNLTVYGLKQDINTGDKIQVRYKEKDDNGNLYIDVDDTFWVVQHNRTRRATGERSSTLTVVSVDRAEVTDTDIISSAVRAIHSEKLFIKPSAFHQSDTYTDTIQNSNAFYLDKDAIFKFTLDDTITDITRIILEWQTTPLFSMTSWDEATAIITGASNPTTPHTHTIAPSSTIGLFEVNQGTSYPSDISIEFNGINIDNHVDVDYITGGNGKWNDGGTNAALDVRMDITDFFLNNFSDIHQKFTITFKATVARTRDVAVPFRTTTTPQNSQVGNQGIVRLKVLTQGVAQAIYKS